MCADSLSLFFLFFSPASSLPPSCSYAGYNFFLGWPIIGVGIFDRDISIPTVMRYPELYISGRLNLDLRSRKMFSWVTMACIHAVFIYFIPLFTFTRIWNPEWERPNRTLIHDGIFPRVVAEWSDLSTQPDGKTSGVYVLGTVTYTCLIAAMHWKVMWHTYSWTWMTGLFMLGISIPLLVLFMSVYSNWINFSPQFYGVAYHVYFNSDLWLTVLLVITCIAIVEYVKERLRLQFFPTATDIAMQLDRGFTAQQEKHQAVSMVDVETPSATPNTTPAGTPLLGPSSHTSSHDVDGRMSPLSRMEELEIESDRVAVGHQYDMLGETKRESGNERIGRRGGPPLERAVTDDYDARMHTSDPQRLSSMSRGFRVDSRGENRPRSNTADSYDHMESGGQGSALERRTMIASSIHGIDLDALGLSVGRLVPCCFVVFVLFFFFWVVVSLCFYFCVIFCNWELIIVSFFPSFFCLPSSFHTSRSRLASSFAYDAPSKEIGRAIFDPKRVRRTSGLPTIPGRRSSRRGSNRSTRSNSSIM